MEGMTLLTEEQISKGLKELKGWKKEEGFLVKRFKFRKFMDGIKFVNMVAGVAERAEHHPDIHIRWTTVTLMIQTHDEGGITELDLDLARKIEETIKKEAKS